MTTFVCPLLVGRDGERREVERVLAAGGAVLVSGPAGVGKTTLVRRSAATDRTVVVGRATPRSTRRPYRPVIDAVLRGRRLAAESGRPAPSGVLALLATGDAGSADLDPLHVADALLGWLPDVCGGEALLVLEDLHWADDETLDVVEHLAQALPVSGFALAATTRNER